MRTISPNLSLFKILHLNKSSKISNLLILINITTQLVLKRYSCGGKFAGFHLLRFSGKRPSSISPLSKFLILSTLVYIIPVVL